MLINATIDPPKLDDITSFANSDLTNKPIKIKINNNKNEIKISLFLACLYSSQVTRMIELDPTQEIFNFQMEFEGVIYDSFYQKIEDFLNAKTVELKEENEIINFAYFGKAFGNENFINPFITYFKDPNKENALNILLKKIKLVDPSNYENEIKIIAENFQDYAERLLTISNDIKYYNIIEEIITNKHFRIPNEGFLLNFILQLCEINNLYERFFEHVWTEFCNQEVLKRFIEYTEKHACNNPCQKAMISCLSRKLLHEKYPATITRYITERISTKYLYKTDEHDPINGILRKENENHNVLLNASSHDCGDPFNLLDENNENHFYTKNTDENQWISASLKDGRNFIITKYMIRGNKHDGWQLQSWILEGKRAEDEIWIELDKHQYEPFSKLKYRVFSITSQDILSEIKLTQIGKNTSDAYDLDINAFEIMGFVFPAEERQK